MDELPPLSTAVSSSPVHFTMPDFIHTSKRIFQVHTLRYESLQKIDNEDEASAMRFQDFKSISSDSIT